MAQFGGVLLEVTLKVDLLLAAKVGPVFPDFFLHDVLVEEEKVARGNKDPDELFQVCELEELANVEEDSEILDG